MTSAHPLFEQHEKVWAPAGDWLLGVRDEFVSEHGVMRVTKRERFVGVEEVFDLSIAHELHTFVANGVVVHNKSQLEHACAVPAPDGRSYSEGDRCECADIELDNRGGWVVCDANDAPTCSCSFNDTSAWSTELGASDAALRDGTWWAGVERSGAGAVLNVERWAGPELNPLPALPGSPHVLNISERGDGSRGFWWATSPTRSTPCGVN